MILLLLFINWHYEFFLKIDGSAFLIYASVKEILFFI